MDVTTQKRDNERFPVLLDRHVCHHLQSIITKKHTKNKKQKT